MSLVLVLDSTRLRADEPATVCCGDVAICKNRLSATQRPPDRAAERFADELTTRVTILSGIGVTKATVEALADGVLAVASR